MKKNIGLKKVNYLYYILLFLLDIVVIERSHYLSVVILYTIWLLFSQNIICSMKKKDMKKRGDLYQYDTFPCTFWIDYVNKRLICLCLFNPFKLQYISLADIGQKDIEIAYAHHGTEYANGITMVLWINGKKNKFGIIGRGRTYGIPMDTLGKSEIEKTREFFGEIDRLKQNENW